MNSLTSDGNFHPRRLVVETDVARYPFAAAIRDRLAGVPVVVVDRADPETLTALPDPELPTLVLAVHRGRFFKPCPGTAASYRCCLYHILHLALGCTIGCSYCVLQGYLNRPFITQFVNLEDAWRELETAFAAGDRFYRVGTGEFTDSLFMDDITALSPRLVQFFARQRQAVLEFKTKSVNIRRLLDYDGDIGETVVSWSVNAPAVAEREEGTAPGIERRLAAAAACRQRGYRIGLHFDPLIWFAGWEEGYTRAVEMIFDYLRPDDIIWISLGAFRFMPPMREVIRDRHPASCIIHGEFIRGLDGKMRYFWGLRRRLYEHLRRQLNRRAPGVRQYYCMEHPEMWRRTFGAAPADNDVVSRLLDRACWRYGDSCLNVR
ncbi:MAG: DNA photolyase [Deltaproteobacteria bacterium]|nr:DNA photolyase [Candidatus Anaeroferrophillacea bacterium]